MLEVVILPNWKPRIMGTHGQQSGEAHECPFMEQLLCKEDDILCMHDVSQDISACVVQSAGIHQVL